MSSRVQQGAIETYATKSCGQRQAPRVTLRAMKHYFHPMSRAMSTNWMLAELDVPHEQVVIDCMAGENNTPEYRAIKCTEG